MLGQAYTIAKSCLVPNKYYAILTVLRYGQMQALRVLFLFIQTYSALFEVQTLDINKNSFI